MSIAGKKINIHKKLHKNLHKNLHKKSRKFNNNKNQVIVGLVHAEWCGHCQQLMPEWKIMEENISTDSKLNKKCKIVKIESQYVDAELPKYAKMTKERNIPVEGYPTIFLIKNHILQKYTGERNHENLKNWVEHSVHGGSNFENNQSTNDSANDINLGGKKTNKTRKNRRTSKKGCSSCNKKNFFHFW